MAKQIIGIGAVANDGTGDSLRVGMDKVNDNFTELYDADVLLAPIASPTFTGVVTMPTPFTLGAVSVLPTGTELNYVAGVTSAIQAQLDLKASSLSPIRAIAAASGNIDATDNIVHVIYTVTGTVALKILTAAIVAGQTWVIKDGGGNASVNNITITCEGGELIDGSATLVIAGDYDAVNLYSNGTNLFIY